MNRVTEKDTQRERKNKRLRESDRQMGLESERQKKRSETERMKGNQRETERDRSRE